MSTSSTPKPWTTPKPSNPAKKHLAITGSPLRLGAFLAPHLWGKDAKFRVDPWYLRAELEIMAAVRGGLVRQAREFLAINAPPQISKSTLVEILTPLWILGHWPSTRIGLIAYNDDLAQDSGAMVRDMIALFGRELFGIEIDSSEDSKKQWRIAGHRGGMLSVGIGSTITGKPMDVVIIGDVLKGMEEAASTGIKTKHWSEFHGAIRARQAWVYLMAHTRFADDDLTGRIKSRQAEPSYRGERWKFLSFPAIAEPDIDDPAGDDPDWRDIIGRKRGEPLQCRHSFPDEQLEENWENSHFYILKRSTDQFEWSCIYQQEPTSPTGGMFDVQNWGWYDPEDEEGIPPIASQRRVWDLAATEGAGDWSVGQLVARTFDGDYLVLDVWRDRKGGAYMKEVVETQAAIDGVSVPILIEEERSGAGKTLVAVYDQALPNHTVEGRRPDGEKHVRARPASMLQQRGKIKLPRTLVGLDDNGNPIYRSPAWVALYIEELRKLMPDGRCGPHDDQIDTLAYAINDMLNVSLTKVKIPDTMFSGRTGGLVTARES